MRFLYVAPRYHTNQIPVMKGLIEHGHSVFFFSHYAGKIEDYSHVVPEIIGYSALFKLINFFHTRVFHRKDPMAADWKLLCGFPPILKMNRRIREVNPDLVILRERSVYSVVTFLICKRRKIRTILYNQSPLYGEVKTDMAHRAVNKLTPKMRITPVIGNPEEKKDPKAFFVPFIMELQCAPDKKEYCQNGEIHIFTVGKYEKRKNLLMMTRVFRELSKAYAIRLTIAGECSSAFHKEYYETLREYIASNRLEDKVTLLQNLKREEMNRIYERTDLFVLPSTLEPASISQLEAMAFSIPVICSDTNGSACYVENGHNGYLFRDNEEKSLKEAMEKIIKDPGLLKEMGRNSYQDVKEKYQFENYYEGVMECICSREE